MKFLNTLLKVKVINYGCNLLIILNKLLNCIIFARSCGKIYGRTS